MPSSFTMPETVAVLGPPPQPRTKMTPKKRREEWRMMMLLGSIMVIFQRASTMDQSWVDGAPGNERGAERLVAILPVGFVGSSCLVDVPGVAEPVCGQKLGITSPLAMVARAVNTFISMVVLIETMWPSQNTKLIPPGWKLPQPYLQRATSTPGMLVQAS